MGRAAAQCVVCGGRAAALGSGERRAHRRIGAIRSSGFARRNITRTIRWRSRPRCLARISTPRTCGVAGAAGRAGGVWRAERIGPEEPGCKRGPHKAQNAERVKEFHDADVEVYALLPYGNNFATWSPALYAATVKAYPNAKGRAHGELARERRAVSERRRWLAVLEAYVKEWAEQCGADGISATFWDNYSAFCQDARCKANGLNKFPNEVYEFLSRYHKLLTPMGQKLHMRTWSSGCPHWLGTNYVHAPGYGQFGLSHPELWATGNQGDAGRPDDADEGIPLRLRAECALHHAAGQMQAAYGDCGVSAGGAVYRAAVLSRIDGELYGDDDEEGAGADWAGRRRADLCRRDEPAGAASTSSRTS